MTEKLTDDLARQFRSLPASDQQRELSVYISELEDRRAQWAADLDNLNKEAPERPGLQQLLDALDKNIEGVKLRMLELD